MPCLAQADVDYVLTTARRRYFELLPDLWVALLLSEFGRVESINDSAARILVRAQRRLERATSLDDPRAEAPLVEEFRNAG